MMFFFIKPTNIRARKIMSLKCFRSSQITFLIFFRINYILPFLMCGFVLGIVSRGTLQRKVEWPNFESLEKE